ncbi:conserved hypothetical protein [Sporisorium reilianum SRZ2]|uniref:Uncharacterized protein n=1 Tax=Sporisorium reilianum (strain SRZ2) TaxID=999809 RepID=E6ZJK9_SPORE|nr:conserved hypothetical protein [Sporisorium reilianum SRZ2]
MPSTRSHGGRRRHTNHSSASSDDDALSRTSSSSSSTSDDGLASKLPTLPDLRFEQSYLATIRGFLHEDTPQHDADEKHHRVDVTHSAVRDEHELWLGNLRVEWFPILYVTLRDQLVSPLIQGAVWGLGGLLLAQVRQFVAARAKTGGQRGNTGVLRGLRRR